jgi:hypothetical protein
MLGEGKVSLAEDGKVIVGCCRVGREGGIIVIRS